MAPKLVEGAFSLAPSTGRNSGAFGSTEGRGELAPGTALGLVLNAHVQAAEAATAWIRRARDVVSQRRVSAAAFEAALGRFVALECRRSLFLGERKQDRQGHLWPLGI